MTSARLRPILGEVIDGCRDLATQLESLEGTVHRALDGVTNSISGLRDSVDRMATAIHEGYD